jgi:membrane protease YdiL (CAAX protease family)
MRPRITSIIAAAVPYAAVVIGLYAVRNGWAAILLYHLGIVLVLIGNRSLTPLRRILTGWRSPVLILAMLAAAVAGPALYFLWSYMDATPSGLQSRLQEFGFDGASWIAFAVYYATIHSFLEELFWRGSARGGALTPGWWDAAFAGYHVLVLWFFIGPIWVGLCFVVLLLTSWLWRLATRRFGGLGVALASHAFADASIVVAATLIARAG